MKALLKNVSIITTTEAPIVIDQLARIFYAGGEIDSPLYRLRRGELEKATAIVRTIHAQGVQYSLATEESLPILLRGTQDELVEMVNLRVKGSEQ